MIWAYLTQNNSLICWLTRRSSNGAGRVCFVRTQRCKPAGGAALIRSRRVREIPAWTICASDYAGRVCRCSCHSGGERREQIEESRRERDLELELAA